MADDNETTVVAYYAIEQVGERGLKRVKRLESCLDDMRRWVSMLEGAGEGDAAWAAWQGAAQKLYTNRLKELLKRMDSFVETYGKYPKDLIRHAQRYAEADGVALNYADDIREEIERISVEWADV